MYNKVSKHDFFFNLRTRLLRAPVITSKYHGPFALAISEFDCTCIEKKKDKNLDCLYFSIIIF